MQPASCVPLAALIKLKNNGKIEKDSTIVLIGTGGGLKYTSVFDKYDLKYKQIDLEEINNI
jgi:threonine synthase